MVLYVDLTFIATVIVIGATSAAVINVTVIIIGIIEISTSVTVIVIAAVVIATVDIGARSTASCCVPRKSNKFSWIVYFQKYLFPSHLF